MKLFNAALIFFLGIVPAHANAFDRNTPESLVIIEEGEVGFITLGTGEPRQVGPGWHNKLPILERVAVIRPDEDRSAAAEVDQKLKTGEACSVNVYLGYAIGDARRAFDWRRKHGLEMRQDSDQSYFEPSRVYEAELSTFIGGLTAHKAMCGAVETWIEQDSASMIGKINADGTVIKWTDLYYGCADDLRESLTTKEAQCRNSPPFSKSFSSSAPGTRRHKSSHQIQR